jgi:acetoin:2,6-dichlorophenolindophenol oxidoreductase subunit beta
MSTQAKEQAAEASAGTVEMSYREAINAALVDELTADPTTLLLGEDVATAGGVFKTNEGLSDTFGHDRIRNTPICENGFMGVALGMAVTGMRPIVEIMFSDFLPTAGDVIVNELPKFRFMSGGQCEVPITIRSICGGTGRFGTQHSATGESWYIGLPGLKVATAGTPGSAYTVLRAAIRSNDPVLFFEHKGLYGRKGLVQRGADAGGASEKAAVLRSGSNVTIVGTLLMVDRALSAAERLAEEGIDAEVVEMRWLRPFDVDSIAESVERTGRLVVLEEQVHVGGWGASLISELTQRGTAWEHRPRVVSLPDHLLVPYSPTLEDAVIPSVERIADEVRAAVA